MGIESVLFYAFLFLASTNAYYKLIPDGKELIYDYHALVHVGSHHPQKFASVFHLNSKVHIQSDAESVLVKHSDLHYKLYNGDVKDESGEEMQHSKWVDIATEMEHMEKPFKVVYDSNGQAKHLVTEKDEVMFVVNMKKSLASLLQMDVGTIDMERKDVQVFHTKELSLYGKTNILYNVHPQNDSLIIGKTWDMDNSRQLYQYMFTNLNHKRCGSTYSDPFIHDGRKVYTIKQKDSYHIVESLVSVGGIYLTPFQGQSETFFVVTNQTMELQTINPVAEKFNLDSEHIYNDFTYYMFDIMDATGPVVDITNGMRNYDMSKMIPKILAMIYDAVNYLDHHHVDMKTPEFKQGQIMNTITRLMMHIYYENYEELHNTLLQKTGEKDSKALELFYHLVPHMGSHASSKFIVHLAKDKVVKDHIVVDILQTMPSFVKMPNYKYVTDMSQLLEMTSVSTHVRKQAALAFSTILSKAIQMHDRLYNHHDEHNNEVNSLPSEHQSDKSFPGEIKYEKYISIMVKHLKESSTDSDRVMWLMCLYNTRMDIVLKYIEPLLKGDWWTDSDVLVKEMALLAVYPMLTKHGDKKYEIYWPVMTNTKLDTSLRIMTMYFMMENAQFQTMMNMFWWMQEETNQEMYQFFYSYIKSWSKTTDECHKMMQQHATKILLYTEPPKYIGVTKYWLMDYTDEQFKFGNTFNWWIIHSETHQTYKFSTMSQMWNLNIDGYTVYLHVKGMDATLFNSFELKLDDPTQLINYEKLWASLSEMPNYKDLEITYIVLKHDHVFMCDTINHEHMEPLNNLINFFFGKSYTLNKNFIHMEYEIYTKVFAPAEIGIPVMWEMLMPRTYDTKMVINKESNNKVWTYNFDCQWKIWSHASYSLAFYNPFAVSWQGISRLNSYDEVFPLYADVMINQAQQSMKLSWRLHKDHDKNIAGWKNHVTTVTFIDDYLGERNTKLKESSPNSHHYQFVTSGSQHKHNYTIHDKDSIGYRHHTAIFDTEKYISNGTYQDFSTHIWTPKHKHYNTPLGYLLMVLLNYRAAALIYPKIGSMGIMNKYEPTSKESPITNIDLSLRFNKEYKKSEWILMPGMKLNTRITCAIKKDDKALKTWDVNTLWDINPGHSVSNWRVYITRIIPDQNDYKICWEGDRKWDEHGLKDHSTIAMSQSADGKCSTEDAVVELNMIGHRSFAQEHHRHPYHLCENTIWSNIKHERSFDCYHDHWSMREYSYNVKMSHVPSEFKRNVMHMFDWFRSWHMSYYTYIEDNVEKIDDNSLTINLEYPTHDNVADISIYTPQHGYNFTGVPLGSFSWFTHHIANLQYPKLFEIMYNFGMIDTCEVELDFVETVKSKVIDFAIPNEWTMYFGDAGSDSKKGIWFKKMDKDKMAMKIMFKTHVLEVLPMNDGDYKFYLSLDGEKVTIDEHRHLWKDWMHYTWMEDSQVLAIFCHHLGVNVVFNADHVTIEIPHMAHQWHGHCLSH